MGKLDGRVTLITGASSGMGRATAVALAKEGAKIVAVARTESKLVELVKEITDAGGVASYVVADCSLTADNKKMVDFALETYGALHVAFLNAGVFLPVSIEEVTDEMIDTTVNTNFKSVVMGLKYCIPVMKKTGEGKGSIIVNTTCSAGQSVVGFDGGLGLYAAVKTASKLYAEYGAIAGGSEVRVNTISPGFVDTNMTSGFPEEVRLGLASSMSLMPKFATPDDIHPLVLFLAGDDSKFITGSEMNIDGGW